MATVNKHKHLTLEERKIIESGIIKGSSKSAIAEVLGKDKSTIGKEIKVHRTRSHRFSLPLECAIYTQCPYSRNCRAKCVAYRPFVCKRRDRSPGACNGCPKFNHCRYDKYIYKAYDAHQEYLSTLIDARLGVDLTIEEAKRIGAIVKPLLDQGQSPYQIVQAHPELLISERTLYTYIENDILSVAGITPMDLRRQVSRKLPKKKARFKKREDRKFLKGRLFQDYKIYIEENETAGIVQMDTVYNDGTKGPFIQTFKFLKYGFLFAVYHEEKTARAMCEGIALLEQLLGDELFSKEAEVVLTDRGSEFSNADGMECRTDGTRRTHIYYCDPMQSAQKGSLENNHIELRYILPKETDLRALGLKGQDDLNKVLSHINSTAKEKLNGKSPIELMEFLQPELLKKFADFGIRQITKDSIVLKPYLLKKG